MKQVIDRLAPLIVLGVFALLLLSVVRSSVFETVEESKHIYFEIVFLLLLAVLGELAVIYLRQPSVMVLMILGMLMSHSFLVVEWGALKSLNLPFALPAEPPNILRFEEVINVFAQLGAVVLLFKVGLHNKIEGIFSMDNMVVAMAGVMLPFFAGFLYASATGGDFAYSMFVGAALTATSVGVTVALLKEFGLIEERFAKIIIGAAVIDDVLGLLVLSFVINVTGGSGSLEPLVLTFISAAVFLLGSVVAGEHFLKYLDRKEMSVRRFLMVLAFMLMYAYVAEFIQLSAIVGAFIAGVILNRSRHIRDIEEKTYGLEMLFMPIFFITLGILVDINALGEFAIPIIIITIIALVTKVVACGAASLWAKLPSREALMVGIGMAPRGEVALIIASLGLTTGVLTTPQYSIISAMALLTTFVVPPLLGWLLKK
ncbi:cation:proton antiporter [Candidatus Micrarchaeota archaeon]|nr:cation:proton antiporter [Candidatus Micrarchaeota archaeon]